MRSYTFTLPPSKCVGMLCFFWRNRLYAYLYIGMCIWFFLFDVLLSDWKIDATRLDEISKSSKMYHARCALSDMLSECVVLVCGRVAKISSIQHFWTNRIKRLLAWGKNRDTLEHRRTAIY